MKLLILSFYFPPDLSAGSFRMAALVKALRAAGGEDLHIELITSMPNRYNTHLSSAMVEEVVPGLRIRRITLPAHSGGMADQTRSFVAFARKAAAMTKGARWDLVFATSSRLMTAALGAYIARRAVAPLYLDIRDLFTDTMSDVFAQSKARHSLPIFKLLERRTLQQAQRVNVVSEGFLKYVQAILPQQDFRVFTNGIDQEFLDANFKRPAAQPETSPVILYAGNMGEGQGLHHVVPELALRLEGKARLRLLGDGGRRSELEEAVRASGCENVELLPPVARASLLSEYRAADLLFLHLNDYPAFHKVLPSKIFEYAATGKPILAGVPGYAAQFLETHVSGSTVSEPCDPAGLAHNAIIALDGPAHWERHEFRRAFARDRIMAEMAEDILSMPLIPCNCHAG